MNIEPGRTLHLSGQDGSDAEYTIRAVRHFPIDFVELEPCDGGPRQTMPLSTLESVMRLR